MRGKIITLDLEATGLDKQTNEIIEVGIALCEDDKILDTYQSFVKPTQPIPDTVVFLTGITEDDVRTAPTIEELIPDIAAFVGDYPIVGHNIEFDVGLLRRYNIAINNRMIDTYELASILLTDAPRYTLSSIIETLDLQLDNAHRALDDAIASWQVYRALWQRLQTVQFSILQEIHNHAKAVEWLGKLAIDEAYQLRVEQGESAQGYLNFSDGIKQNPQNDIQPLPAAASDSTPIDLPALTNILESDSDFAKAIDQYEYRESQAEMLKAVGKAFNQREHLMIEAPTGIGKSIAYLLPAIQWAVNNNQRVLISTRTHVLQDQLIKKDIPLLQANSGLNFSATTLKGRHNYLCLRQLDNLRRRSPTSAEELRVLAKVLVWLSEGGTGHLEEISIRGLTEHALWTELSSAHAFCTPETCGTQANTPCPFYLARERAERAHIIVVNHALLLADVIHDQSQVLPPYQHLIIDEAHHLEQAVTQSLQNRLTNHNLTQRLNELGNAQRGIIGDLRKHLDGNVPDDFYRGIRDYTNDIIAALESANQLNKRFFAILRKRLLELTKSTHNGYRTNSRITNKIRQHPNWERISKAWHPLSEHLLAISAALNTVAKQCHKLPNTYKDKLDIYDALIGQLRAASIQLADVRNMLDAFIKEPDDNLVYWVTTEVSSEQIVISTAPLHVGYLTEKHLWDAKDTVILTSATLKTSNNFDYISERLSTEYMTATSVESPFNYKDNALVFLPMNMPDIRERDDYQPQVERTIIELATATNGRMMVLFTSYTQLRATVQNVTPRLALGNIQVFDQGSGSGEQALIENFKAADKAVLMVTGSFWEGVDLPGDDLSVIVMPRLPFSVPSDPVLEARAETYGDDSFLHHLLPDAILNFRQGFGRLLRRKTDRGVLVILDRRVTAKRYGHHFLESLPNPTFERGMLHILSKTAADWLDIDINP